MYLRASYDSHKIMIIFLNSIDQLTFETKTIVFSLTQKLNF